MSTSTETQEHSTGEHQHGMTDAGYIKIAVILAALRYMSDAQVRDMAEVNGFLPEDPEEEIRSDYQEAMTANKSLI